jgi:hypothetical protein
MNSDPLSRTTSITVPRAGNLKSAKASGNPSREAGLGGLFGGLNVSQKLAMIAAAFIVPIAVLLFLLVSTQAQAIDFAAKEKVGAKYLGDIAVVFDDIKRHRREARNALRDPSSENKQKLTEAAVKVDASLAALSSDSALASQYQKLAETQRRSADPRSDRKFEPSLEHHRRTDQPDDR